jgi:hypothetical protein
MKKLLFVLALSVAGTIFGAEQKYLLPIGSNVNNRPAEVSVIISSLDTWARLEDKFTFQPPSRLEDVIRYRTEKLFENYQVPKGFERGEFALNVQVTPGPFSQSIFHFQKNDSKWTVPTEVLKVKLDYGAGIGWVIPGIRLIELDVEDSTGVHHFSSDNVDGYDSACFFGVQNEALKQSAAVVLKEYAVPEFQAAIGLKWGRITFRAQDGYGTFNVLDGLLVDVSTPPPAFMDSLRAPEMSPVTSGPKISRIFRKGNTTEITVSAEAGSKAYLEFAEVLSGAWNAVPAYSVPLSLQTGQNTFAHTTESPATFYRLRIAGNPGQ